MGGREERKERPTAVPSSPGAVSTAPSGLHKGRPRPPRGTVVGGGVVLPAPAAVRRGWGGARAGRRPERGVGQPEGGPAAPAAAHCLQTARSRTEGRIVQSEAGASAAGPRRRVWSVRLCGRARAGRKWDSSSPRRAAGSSGRTQRRRKEPPAAEPLPFRFH